MYSYVKHMASPVLYIFKIKEMHIWKVFCGTSLYKCDRCQRQAGGGGAWRWEHCSASAEGLHVKSLRKYLCHHLILFLLPPAVWEEVLEVLAGHHPQLLRRGDWVDNYGVPAPHAYPVGTWDPLTKQTATWWRRWLLSFAKEEQRMHCLLPWHPEVIETQNLFVPLPWPAKERKTHSHHRFTLLNPTPSGIWS